MLLTVNKVNETISGVIDNSKYSLPFNEEAYKLLLGFEKVFSEAKTIEEAKAILEEAKKVTERKSSDLITQACPYLKLDDKTGLFYLTQGGKTSRIPLPKVLADRIIESFEKQIPFEPLVKAWIWFLRNPNFSVSKAENFANYLTTTVVDKEDAKKFVEEDGYSAEKANELATYNDVSITTNGLLSTYKYAKIKYTKFDSATGDVVDRYSVTYDEETGEATVNLPTNAEDYYLIPPIKGESGDAFYAGEELGHRIKVGSVHNLPDWSFVNTDDRQSCVKGLHLGGLRYIAGYGGQDRLLLNCLVNPMHIGAFDHDGRGAIRVLEYFVHSANFAPNKELYRESSYLARTEAQWADMRAEAIEKSEAAIAKLKEYQDEINAF